MHKYRNSKTRHFRGHQKTVFERVHNKLRRWSLIHRRSRDIERVGFLPNIMIILLLVLGLSGGLYSVTQLDASRLHAYFTGTKLPNKAVPKSFSTKKAANAKSTPKSAKAVSNAAPAATSQDSASQEAKLAEAQAAAAKPSVVTLSGRVDPVCVSSHIDRLAPSDVDRQTTLMQAAGVNWVRFDVAWAAIEKTKGAYNWSSYDYDVNSVTSRGMKPLVILTQYGLPSWERLDQSNWLSTPNNMVDFQNFAAAFAQHFRGRISLYEIGNEPNMNMFWPSGPDAAAYTQLLIAGYRGVKSADPSNIVISAGLANISAASYLQRMYDAGAKGYFDYVGFHPYSYPQSPDATQGTVFSLAAGIHQVMANNGQGSKEIMATELGWPSTVASGGVDEATQATYVSRVFQKIEFEDFKYIPIACMYDFINDGTDTTNNEDNFGLVRADYSQKPAFAALRQVRNTYNANFSPISP